MNEEQIKKGPNYILGGSILAAAILFSTAWIYSAKLETRGEASANSVATDTSHSAPAYAQPSAPQQAAPVAPARTSGGCGV